MSQFLDRLERVRGLPVLVGVALILLNFIVRCIVFALAPVPEDPGLWLFLFTDGNLLLHLGAIVGLMGVLIGDIL
jgi:membrane protein DedA with SNARE-associated domain